ncbi:MAG: metalloprotease TldD [Gammaproteobacteria bacterium CG22_combo_CG10-13_8_21_14_all_40_8]|nr:MAG: metalloprotease TldD [Gammaproteobacteria bacterium CG22_combo_CG10-13_8_21_14_all_40_8]
MNQNSNLKTAIQHFILDQGLSLSQAENILSCAFNTQMDYADLYFQVSRSESWSLEDGLVKDGTFHQEQGAGIRSMIGEQTGFAYTEALDDSSLRQAAQAASKIAKSTTSQKIHIKNHPNDHQFYPNQDPINQVDSAQKIELLKYIDRFAKSLDPRITQVMASYSASFSMVLVLNSQGELAADLRPMCRIGISVIAEQNKKRERGSSGGGGRALPLDLFWKQDSTITQLVEDYARQAVNQALINLDACPTMAGLQTVILGSGWPGILLHEAIGHGLEGDFNRKNTSAFSNKMGEIVASPLCTIVDDATILGHRGSLNIDDEGVTGQNTLLIDKGRLCGYMQDRKNARLMKTQSTGNGRRESYAQLPMPRMTNTYMLPGEHSHQEIIASVKSGIYAPNFGGGQVDITSGKFVFSASEAYQIENGKITHPLKGATFIGSGPEILKQVSMVGNNLALDPGVGVCGKDGQSVPVGVGQPTLKIDQLLVGGTES